MEHEEIDPRSVNILYACDVLLALPNIQKSLSHLQQIHAIKQDASEAKDDVAVRDVEEKWSIFFSQLPLELVKAYEDKRNKAEL